MRIIPILLFLASPILAADPVVHRDIPYEMPENKRQMLDVYAPAEGKNHPVMIWIHGGGWRGGNKTGVHKMAQAFVDKGFVFVATTYRVLPDVSMKEITADIARAIHWVHDHAGEFGGDPDTIFVIGRNNTGGMSNE